MGERPPRCWCARAAGTWTSGTCWWTAGRCSASLFDFGLYFFHNARELLDRGSGPYFYLPKLESHLEARLWNDVFDDAQEALGIPRGTIRATVLIETILAAFEMEEILYELRDHAAGLNAGRWDYIFSVIKKFRHRPEYVLPDRAQVTMAVPFMRAYTELLVQDLPPARGARDRRHGRVHPAAGGTRRSTRRRWRKVREDKEREAGDGLRRHVGGAPRPGAGRAPRCSTSVLGGRPHQKDRLPRGRARTRRKLLDVRVPGGRVTEAGVRGNVSVALQYLEAWLRGIGSGGDQQPDGRRGHRRDRAGAALAVDPPRHRRRRRGR